MTVKLKVYANEDDALLFWSVPGPIPGCRGFAIERQLKDPSGKATTGFLPNRIGFENQQLPNRPAQGATAPTEPSTEWPFQRFSWTDHDANTGDTVSYRVIPVVRDAGGTLSTQDGDASPWSGPRTLGLQQGPFSAFFNRGFVMAQFMARYLAEKKLTLAQFKRSLDKHEDAMRVFLSGDLRTTMLKQLATVSAEGGEVYGALFELLDDELISALAKLGRKAHLVLANGSITKKKTETSEEARARDENAQARKKLKRAGVDVALKDRFISPGALGHNKFLVRTDKSGKPAVAWTGSTNWTPTGLCTQLNNGLLVDRSDVAKVYLDQWKRLRAAKSAFPPSLVAANSSPKELPPDATVFFTRTSKGVDLQALRQEVNKAQQGILFLMFMPGSAGLFATVAARAQEPNLYVRGVVSEIPHGVGDESSVNVNLVAGAKQSASHLDIVQPEGMTHPSAFFAAEVSRTQFLGGIGHAIIHSKVVVIDPFSDSPVVITGSHNFSTTASSKNDENFIIIRGNKGLAESYAVNILGAYDHYRWRAYLGEKDAPLKGLKDDDQWLAPRLAAERTDLAFWGV